MNKWTAIALCAAFMCAAPIGLNATIVDPPLPKHEDVGTVIGIDLGTTYSCVGVYKNGHVEIIANDQGNRITPSYVAFTAEGDRLVGDAAKFQLTSNPENTIFDVKRLIGRVWTDPLVQSDREVFPFKLKEKNGKPHVAVAVSGVETLFAPEEISAMILSRMRETAEAYLGKNVTHAVVTVPACTEPHATISFSEPYQQSLSYTGKPAPMSKRLLMPPGLSPIDFTDAQRQATRDAATIAGLTAIRVINEPTAAAIAYGLDQQADGKTVLVFDLGGGTFDVTLLTIDSGIYEVLATNGDTHLGGEDFDQRVMTYFVRLYKKKTGKDVSFDVRALQKLRREVEKAKRTLSTQHQTKIEIDSFFEGDDFVETLTRARFEELNADLFKDTLKPVLRVLADGKVAISEVDEIVLVGGSTRIPRVQQLVKEFFNGKEPSQGINPDEAVAYGAAVQGGLLGGESADLLVLDVNSLSVGIETVGGVMSTLIPRNKPVPNMKAQIFSTATDDQDTVTIRVFEGERAMTKDNNLLGKFDLRNIPRAPRGVPQIEVTFEIDVNGVLHVSAENKGAGGKGSITIANDQNRLSQEEIGRMLEEAERMDQIDKQLVARIGARNSLEGYLYGLKNQLNDEEKLGGHLSIDAATTVMEAVHGSLNWLGDNLDAEAAQFDDRRKQVEGIVVPIIAAGYTDSGHQFIHESDDTAGGDGEL